MDFDFKKARKNKQKQDKARSTRRHHPDQKSKHNNIGQSSGVKAHATPLESIDKPTSYTETDPAQFLHLKRETEDITALTETKSFSRRVIVSNWERYELPPDTPEERLEGALDFETLVNSLSDVKGHLKLSREHSWGNERSELQEVLFNIDMLKLCANLERVPFHARQNLPVSLFTPEQLAIFEQDADNALKQCCMLKIAPKEDSLWQKLPVTPANVPSTIIDHDNKPSNTTVYTPDVSEKNDSSSNVSEESSSTINVTKAKPIPKLEKELECVITEKSVKSGVSPTSQSDELDLDFLLSLDAAVPDKPKVSQQIDPVALGAVTASKSPETGKLDDWLDNLLDD